MLNEYPRPQLVRDSYISLNGEWEYAIRKDENIPSTFDGIITVPYSPETKISGVNKIVTPEDCLFYKKEFLIKEEDYNDKIILHFGAVDQICDVYINDNYLGTHIGGFLPFEYDIRPYIKENNVLILRVKDVTDTSYYSRAKQRIKRGGIWYSPQSGIYMPVWLESVSNDYIKNIKINPDIDKNIVNITIYSDSNDIEILFLDRIIKTKGNETITINIDNPILWSPENPYLYYFKIKTHNDEVSSYFAMRKFSCVKDKDGITRLALNNSPYFMKGVLDQGYYRDGFLTPMRDEDYIKDIKTMKEMGFNTLRKHIKIESLRWYYHCDRLGMIVWQDFVSGGRTYKLTTISLPLITDVHHKDTDYKKFGRMDEEGRKETIQEFKDTIELLYNVPSIGLWTIFNEGWGQFDAVKVYNEMIKLDNSRIYDHASGWHDQGVSDTKSLHVYFKRAKMPNKKKTKDRAIILSECGGYTLPIKGHMFSNKVFGYKPLKTSDDLVKEYRKFINLDVLKNIPKGLSAFIYTQLSDVEDELNGFMTYDREVIKVDPKDIKDINDEVKY